MTHSEDFLITLDRYYHQHGRSLPWRAPEPDSSFDPYKILVSEIMLQQTQVPRVIPKYQSFLQQFPDAKTLAAAQLSEVLAQWVGLGYNRRAKFLHEAVRNLVSKSEPWSFEDLVAQKGIGPNTAAAVLAYSYDLEVLFVETNIRTVIIHHFFHDQQGISDKEILETLGEIVPWKIEQTSTLQSPRQFYWAMMDYGVRLKATVGNLNRQSKTYAKQSKFTGSKRQVRGRIIRTLVTGPMTLTRLREEVADERFDDVLASLSHEKMVRLQDDTLMLYNESDSL